MIGEVEIRPATPDDVPLLASHRSLMFEDMRTSQAFRCSDEGLARMESQYESYLQQQLANEALLVYVAEVDGSIVASGCVTILDWPPGPGSPDAAVGLLHSMYTTPDCRKRGIGESIVKALTDASKARGCRQLIIGGPGTNAGRHLYETLGFRAAENMRLNL